VFFLRSRFSTIGSRERFLEALILLVFVKVSAGACTLILMFIAFVSRERDTEVVRLGFFVYGEVNVVTFGGN
jgi:hypothetical protein